MRYCENLRPDLLLIFLALQLAPYKARDGLFTRTSTLKEEGVMKKQKRTGIISMLFLGIALILTGCGGSGGGGGGISDYTIGGTVSGLSGTVVLQNNGGDDRTITADGAFTFATALADGSGYNVTVKTQPAGQTCTVSKNTGTISGADVTDVTVTCSVDTYTVGGTVSGLSGTVALQNNGGDDLTISADGAFTFSTAIADGSDYSVTVKTQPSGQSCFVPNGSGTVSGANVTDVTMNCVTSTMQDFEDGTLAGWTAGGRQSGGSTNLWGVSEYAGSQMAYLYHRGFTELTLSKSFSYSPDMTLSFDAEFSIDGNTSPTPSGSSEFTSYNVWYSIGFRDIDGNDLGSISYPAETSYWLSNSWTSQNKNVSILYPNGLQHYEYDNISALASKLDINLDTIDTIVLGFGAYSPIYNSLWMIVRFDNVGTLSAALVPKYR